MPKTRKRKLKRYHFDLGDSNTGPVGLCAVVFAYTKSEAVHKLRHALPESHEVIAGDSEVDDGSDVDYLTVYFNHYKITTKDIDWVEDAEDE